MPEMWRPRAKSRPVKNFVDVRAAVGGFEEDLVLVSRVDVVSAMRLGIVRAARIVTVARSARATVVVVDG